MVALVSIRELPTDDVIVNINKGYALRRIGTYSPNMIEQVVHTFVSLDNFCAVQTTDAVCIYSSASPTANIMELNTMVTSRHTRYTTSIYDREHVSKLISTDLSHVLVQHKPDEFLRDTKSSVHFINNQFHYQKNDNQPLSSTSSTNTVDRYSDILRFRPTSVDTIIKQINSNRISFEYLSSDDLKLFLTTIFSSIDDSYQINDIQESLNAFSQLIIGQSIYALRYCTLSRQHPLSSKPCLAVSTLFLRIPSNSRSIYSIYSLLPLPIVVENERYIYSNLPNVFGINYIEQTLIMWNNELENNECTFSPIVWCHNKPISLPLSQSSCLSQLFDDYQSVTDKCQVNRLPNIGQGIMYIVDGLWLFYNTHLTYYCQVNSTLNELIETISITEAVVVRVPCDTTITCLDFKLSAASCKGNRIIITPTFTSTNHHLSHFFVPIQNMKQTLVSAYHTQLEKFMTDLMLTFPLIQSKFKDTIHDIGLAILSFFCSIFILIFGYIFKYIKYQHPREINDVRSQIEDIVFP